MTVRRCLVVVIEADVPEGDILAPIAADALDWYADAVRKGVVGATDVERVLVQSGGHSAVVKTVHGASDLYVNLAGQDERNDQTD